MTKRQKTALIGGDLLVILAILGLGFALLVLAVPRTVAHSKMAPGKAVLSDLSRGKTVGPERLHRSIASHKEALSWLDMAGGWIDIGTFRLALARRPDLTEAARRALLQQSKSAISAGLSLSPARPFAWTRLAQTHQMLDSGAPAIDPLLRMSMTLGAREPDLLTQRVRIGYAARAALSEATRNRLAADVRLWALHDSAGLAEWGRRNFALPWIRRALEDDASLHGRFLSSYLRLPAR